MKLRWKSRISATLLEFINASEVREDDEEYENPGRSSCSRSWKRKIRTTSPSGSTRKYKLAAGKTAKSILISCGARLAPFDIAELREVTAYDELELDTLGDRKTALFLIMSDTDDTFNFLISMCYTQLFNLLCDKADDVYGGQAAGTRPVPDRRVRQHRPDTKAGKAHGHDPKPRDFRLPRFAGTIPAQGSV
jgi:hypothetical protein